MSDDIYTGVIKDSEKNRFYRSPVTKEQRKSNKELEEFIAFVREDVDAADIEFHKYIDETSMKELLVAGLITQDEYYAGI